MKIAPTKSVKADFLAVYRQCVEEAILIERSDPGRLYNLRCSQIPYCPRSVVAGWLTKGMFQPINLMMAFYTQVGHAVHDVMQKYIATSGRLLADYQCIECKKWHRLSHKHECCGIPCKYHEVEIKFKGIVGHIDAVYKDKYGRYWILDFKTCSLTGLPYKIKSTPIGYRKQICSYAYLLWKQYGIKVEGVALVYIPRDNPKSPDLWELPFKERDWTQAFDDLKFYRNLHKKTMKAKTLADFRDVFKQNCQGEYCRACKMTEDELIAKLRLKKPEVLAKFPIKKEELETENV